MLNKNKILIITVMGIIANLPSANAQTQTFYQCMPCPAGTYGSNGKCTPCPAGTYSQVSGATSSNVCRECPDYQWSDAGSYVCGDVKVKINKNSGDRKTQMSKWIKMSSFSGSGYKCDIEYDKTDKYKHYENCTITDRTNWMVAKYKEYLVLLNNCKRLPCVVAAPGDPERTGRKFVINTDGSMTEYDWRYRESAPITVKGSVTW